MTVRIYETTEKRLYLAEDPRNSADLVYHNMDEYIMLAVHLHPDSTVQELLPNIELIRNKQHPAQLASKGRERILAVVNDQTYVNETRLNTLEHIALAAKKAETDKQLAEEKIVTSVKLAPVAITPQSVKKD